MLGRILSGALASTPGGIKRNVYDGGPWRYGVDILEFRGDKVSRESAYSMDTWEAPDAGGA